MKKYLGELARYPARSALAWYLAVIAVGTMLLTLPISRQDGREPISLVDAAFTATSATCVTGLTVRSTANDFSFFGQFVILVLMQLGGIGIITITTFVALALGGSESLRRTLVVTESVGTNGQPKLRQILTVVMLAVCGIEAVGFCLLVVRNVTDQPLSVAAWDALFHSISAFCNAGFSLHEDSFVRYQTDPFVNGTIILLIVLGGLGFPVLLDLTRNARWGRASVWERLNLHTKLMLIGSAVLLAVGSVSFLALEWNHSLSNAPVGTKFLSALFHSTTTRTAGFFTTDVSSLSTPTMFITMLLMLVGAGPCSTGGGLKVSSLAILVLGVWSRFRGASSTAIFRRRISRQCIDRAVTTALLFAVVVAIGLAVLLIAEHKSQASESETFFLDHSFEVTSALGTVGLSTGITPTMSDSGKIIVMLLMIVGRLGPISVFIALSHVQEKPHLTFPEEDVLVG